MIFVLDIIEETQIVKLFKKYKGYFSGPIYLSLYLFSTIFIYYFKDIQNTPKLALTEFVSCFICFFLFYFQLIYFVDTMVYFFENKLNKKRNR